MSFLRSLQCMVPWKARFPKHRERASATLPSKPPPLPISCSRPLSSGVSKTMNSVSLEPPPHLFKEKAEISLITHLPTKRELALGTNNNNSRTLQSIPSIKLLRPFLCTGSAKIPVSPLLLPLEPRNWMNVSTVMTKGNSRINAPN